MVSSRPAVENSIIHVEGITKTFGEVKALQGVDLRVEPGTVLGLLGPNGAGKTTLVKVLTTLLKPDSGRATIAGLDVVRDAERLRTVIGLAGQYAAVDEYLTGRENLMMVGQLYHLPAAEARRRADDLLARFSLTDAANRPARTYSGGMRHRLDLAASLINNPQVLFLDEPTTGLDPRTRLDLWELIRDLVREGTTLLLTTQYLEEADELADRIAVIDNGQIIAKGTATELKASIGSDILEVRVANSENLQRAAEVLDTINDEHPQIDDSQCLITLAASDGVQSIVAAVRCLDDANIQLTDLSLRRPTLDDVFLTLTGRRAENEAAADEAGSD
ncbi:MAG: ATP-binding cassette domain-containing protein [Chloroflexi bacterium]|nr:ATP-binding cassette domain-containing protein [Chloroflexota bacterium]